MALDLKEIWISILLDLLFLQNRLQIILSIQFCSQFPHFIFIHCVFAHFPRIITQSTKVCCPISPIEFLLFPTNLRRKAEKNIGMSI